MRNATYQVDSDRETEALTFGRYELTRKLSQGGMAEIWLARQSGIENFEKQVCIKIVLPTLADLEDYEDMLLNEARMAARLNHPNIVQILDLGKLDGRFFVAMEYLEGENLLSIVQRAIKSQRQLPVGFICRVIADMLSGLEYAHAQVGSDGKSLGIIHRDISPPNVIVTFAGATKLVDFGIAKATRSLEASVTNAGQFKGKLSYMSPEQLRRQPLDGRTDLFSTGVLLWELVTQKRLFRRTGDAETARAVLEQEIVPASSINPECPPALDAIIAKALQRPTQARYPSARAMRKALEELIRQQNWPTDSLTVQRVMFDLFGDKTGTLHSLPPLPLGSGVTSPVLLNTPKVPQPPAPPRETKRQHEPKHEEEETTQRSPKAALEALDAGKEPPFVEITSSFDGDSDRTTPISTTGGSNGSSAHAVEPIAMPRVARPAPPPTFNIGTATIDHMMRRRRHFRVGLTALTGLALFAVGAFGYKWVHHRGVVPPPALIVAAAPVLEEAQPSAAKPAPAPTPSAVTVTTEPARARVEVHVDVKAVVTLDGETIDVNTPVEIDPAAHHVVAVQRPGHHTVRTLELPKLEPGQHFVVGLYLKGLPEAKPAVEDKPADDASDEEGASSAPGPVATAAPRAAAPAAQ